MENGTRISVLDKGYVELVDHMGDDSYAIRAARMSTGKGFQGWDKDENLLRYLYANRHMTPFEMSELILEVKAPIFVFRQWHRHRTQSFNEFSGRYSVMPDEYYIPDTSRFQGQDTKNRQGSAGAVSPDIAINAKTFLVERQEGIHDDYLWMMDKGIAKELARINTPVSCYSKMWAKANLRNWLHFESLRLDEHAQWETRQYAEAVSTVIKSLWPRTYALFEEHTLNARTFSASEVAILRGFLSGELKVADLYTEIDEKTRKALLAKLDLLDAAA